jgi:hypothetical protein
MSRRLRENGAESGSVPRTDALAIPLALFLAHVVPATAQFLALLRAHLAVLLLGLAQSLLLLAWQRLELLLVALRTLALIGARLALWRLGRTLALLGLTRLRLFLRALALLPSLLLALLRILLITILFAPGVGRRLPGQHRAAEQQRAQQQSAALSVHVGLPVSRAQPWRPMSDSASHM